MLFTPHANIVLDISVKVKNFYSCINVNQTDSQEFFGLLADFIQGGSQHG